MKTFKITAEEKEMIEKRRKAEAFIHDNVLEPITNQEIIITIQTSEKYRDEKTVYKVFENLLKLKVKDARHLLKKNMSAILNEAGD